MTNLPSSAQSGDLDNLAVTRAQFRDEIGVLLEYLAQALGDVGGDYTTEAVVPTAVILQGTPTIEAGAKPADADRSTRIPSTEWVKEAGRYVGDTAPAAPVDGTVSMDCRDPVLRKKFHVVVDTNVWIKAAKTSFSFFDVLEAYFETKVVVVIPFVVYLELDHLKKGNRADLAVGDVSRKCINYINKRINSGKNGFVIQTVEEDDLCTESSKEKKHGTKNDMRVVFCCKHRLGKGMKVILLSGDVNVLNLGMSMSGGETFYDRDKSVKGTSPGIECLFFEPLAALLQDPRYARLEPALWGKILKARAAHRTR